jgi:hypothetical protein
MRVLIDSEAELLKKDSRTGGFVQRRRVMKFATLFDATLYTTNID